MQRTEIRLRSGADVYDEIVVRVNDAHAELVARATLPELHLEERKHLQEWVLAHPAILGDGVDIITAEYDKWQSADGNPVADRLDVLGIDPDGRLVVAELKRAEAPHTVHMQAINYAAMVSRLKPGDVAELYAAHRPSGSVRRDVDSALTWLESEKLLTAETIKHPRIVLIASHFPPSVTASVVWLNEQGVSISLVRFRPYRLASGETIVSFSRLYPVPDVEEFTIGRRPDGGGTPVADDGPPWDEAALRRLAAQGNAATIGMLDLCAAEEADAVTVKDIAAHAEISEGQVRGQLAGLTMRLRNPKYGFDRRAWPVTIEWLAGGVATYHMDEDLAAMWRTIRNGVQGLDLPGPSEIL